MEGHEGSYRRAFTPVVSATRPHRLGLKDFRHVLACWERQVNPVRRIGWMFGVDRGELLAAILPIVVQRRPLSHSSSATSFTNSTRAATA